MRTAEQLGLTEAEHAALVATLQLLESGGLEHVGVNVDSVDDNGFYSLGPGHYFSMSQWVAYIRDSLGEKCGTVCCIGGTAERLGAEGLVDRCWRFSDSYDPALDDLCFPVCRLDQGFADITTVQAARALRNYLETGGARWQEVLR